MGLVEFSVVVVGFVFSVALQVFIVLFVAVIMVIVCLAVLIIFVVLVRAVAFLLVRSLVCSGRGPSSQEFHVQSFIFTLLLLYSRDCSFNLIKKISSTSLASLSSLTTL